MIVTTTNEISGKNILSYKGIARGIVVRSPSMKQGFVGGLKMIAGGNNPVFTEVCEKTRKDAYDQMIEHAKSLGANAVIAMRFDAVSFSDAMTEVIAYGTAVVIDESP